MKNQFSSDDIEKFKREDNKIINKMYKFFEEENIKSKGIVVIALKSDFKRKLNIYE